MSNQTILLVGFVGLKASLDILQNNQEELSTRFPISFLQQTKNLDSLLLKLDDIKGMVNSETRIYPLGSGGVYTTLWQVCHELQIGHMVDVSQIPIRQETVEICEYYRLNPYCIDSEGSYLVFSHNPEELVKQLEEQNIKVAIIGETNNTKRKEIKRGDEICSLPRMK